MSDLKALQSLTTPTVSNAIERFGLRPWNQGFMSPEIRCLLPELGIAVGYAVTARYAAKEKPAKPGSRYDFWKYILTFPEPRIMVMEDLDNPPGVGAYFGEVQTTIHKRLGCIGVVTNGYVRDLDEVRALKFHYFAGGLCVSHAYVHLVDFGTPVKIGGLEVKSGDLIHADQRGVLSVPKDVVARIPEAAQQVADREAKIMGTCSKPDFTLEKLRDAYESA